MREDPQSITRCVGIGRPADVAADLPADLPHCRRLTGCTGSRGPRARI